MHLAAWKFQLSNAHLQEPLSLDIIAFILSFFRNVISKSSQIDSLKNAQDYPKKKVRKKGKTMFADYF